MPLENLEKTRAMAQYFVFTEATNADRRSRSYLREKRDVLPMDMATLCVAVLASPSEEGATHSGSSCPRDL